MKCELAVRCPKCGRWMATTTNSLETGKFRCKVDSCKCSRKLRNSKGWNIIWDAPYGDETLADCVARLNVPK